MDVYLVQHAEAKSEEEDPDRPLSEKGREDAQAVAALASKMALDVGQIRHSGKTRAEQTATILGQALSPAERVVAASGLGPLDDVEPVAKELTRASQPLMLVGHLPFMERLAGYMATGDSDRAAVKFHNGGIVCLTQDEDQWQVSWILTPEIAKAAETDLLI